MTSERLRQVLGRYKYTVEYIAVCVTVLILLHLVELARSG